MPTAPSILLVVENLPLPFDRRVWLEATSLRDDGWSVSVVCPKGGEWQEEYEVIDGIHIHRHDMPAEGTSKLGFIREYMVALYREARLVAHVRRTRPFHVIHICNPPDLLFVLAAWQRIRHGVTVVFDQHDLNPELYRAKYGAGGMMYAGVRAAERLTYMTAHKVISTNESYRAVAIDRGGKAPQDVRVVRSGPDLGDFAPVAPRDEFRRGRRYLVGYLGVMGAQDGVDYLLRAIRHATLVEGRDDIHFMLIGGGPELDSLRSHATELGIDAHVEFTGRIPDDELIARLSSADVCVNPDPANGFNELCTMNKILEYMALGKPIVQFDLLEGRRSAGPASVYAPANDERAFAEAIIELLDDEERRRTMGTQGRKRMETQLEWRHQRPQLLELYRELRPGGPVAEADAGIFSRS